MRSDATHFVRSDATQAYAAVAAARGRGLEEGGAVPISPSRKCGPPAVRRARAGADQQVRCRERINRAAPGRECGPPAVRRARAGRTARSAPVSETDPLPAANAARRSSGAPAQGGPPGPLP